MMDPLARLPVECLQLILKFITETEGTISTRTLAALLCVNKYIATVTVPFLYCDPYRGNSMPPYGRLIQRPCTFLSFLPVENIPQLLSLRLAQYPSYFPSPAEPAFDYLTHIRHLCPPHFHIGCGTFDPNKYFPNQEELDYFRGDECEQLRKSVWTASTYLDSLCSKLQFDAHLHNVIIYRQMLWSIASPILDRLESLTILVSDMDRYREQINRLERLEKIEFKFDDVYTSYEGRSDGSSTERKESKIEAVVQFVMDHTRIFPGCLKVVTVDDSRLWPKCQYTNFEDVQSRIYRLLPPMPPPTEINKDSWMKLMAQPLTTDLGRVQTFTASQEQWQNPVYDYGLIFQRCRDLRSLNVSAPGRGTFEWAVQEKRLLDLGGTRRLVPLEHVHITDYTLLSDEVNDIAFAFSDTLQSITVHDIIQPGPFPTIWIGKGWVDLPLLTQLSLDIRRNRLVVDEMMLFHCPSLTHLDLMDITEEYRAQDIIPSLPAHLGQLEDLKLQGGPAFRILNQSDFFTTKRYTTTIHSERLSKPRHVVAPRLVKLRLTGIWEMDDSLVESFFHVMFPKLREVFMSGLKGFSHGALVRCLKNKATHVARMRIGCDEPTEEEQHKLGLYPRAGRKKGLKDTWHFIIHFSNVEYLVRRDHAIADAPGVGVVS
ncbi:hypothetical protein EC991_006213 [Linnemannia zychae]|nr:hypothetical protein EC991_006213 [Linnemannia zychae]